MDILKIDTTNKRDVKRVLDFPFQLYRDVPQWVPPFASDARRMLDRGKHPFYQHSSAEFFIAVKARVARCVRSVRARHPERMSPRRTRSRQKHRQTPRPSSATGRGWLRVRGGWLTPASANPRSRGNSVSAEHPFDAFWRERNHKILRPYAASPEAAPVSSAQQAVRLSFITEAAIREHLLEQLERTRNGDVVRIATFYLSDRAVIRALLDAAARGVSVRVLLDPNRDAFGRQKDGVPNRPVANNLSRAARVASKCAGTARTASSSTPSSR